MTSLQELFNEVEQNLEKGLEHFAVNCEYRILMKTITQLNDQVFEMLYSEDTENISDYDLEDVDLSLEFSKLQKLTEK